MFQTRITLKLGLALFSVLPLFASVDFQVSEQAEAEHLKELNHIIVEQMFDPNNELLNKAAEHAQESMKNEKMCLAIRRYAYDLSILAIDETARKRYPAIVSALKGFPELDLPTDASLGQYVLANDTMAVLRAIICKTVDVPLSLERLYGPGLWAKDNEGQEPVNAKMHGQRVKLNKMSDKECAEIIKQAAKAYRLNRDGKFQEALLLLKKPHNSAIGVDPAAVVFWG